MKLSPLDLSYMGVCTIWSDDLGTWEKAALTKDAVTDTLQARNPLRDYPRHPRYQR